MSGIIGPGGVLSVDGLTGVVELDSLYTDLSTDQNVGGNKTLQPSGGLLKVELPTSVDGGVRVDNASVNSSDPYVQLTNTGVTSFWMGFNVLAGKLEIRQGAAGWDTATTLLSFDLIVTGPASSITNQLAVFSDASGKEIATVPVTVDPVTRSIKNIGTTEQDSFSYMKRGQSIIWTTTGTPAGVVSGRVEMTNSDEFRVRLGPTGGDRVIYAVRNIVEIRPWNVLVLRATGSEFGASAVKLEIFEKLILSDDIIYKIYTDDVSSPPTDAELDAIFGTPATVGAGFTADIDDNGAGTNFYTVKSDGTNWWIFTGTKAV